MLLSNLLFSISSGGGRLFRRCAPGLAGMYIALQTITPNVFADASTPPPSFTWSRGDFISTGSGYSLGTGQIARTVVDINVVGSVGQLPLRWIRTLHQVNYISGSVGWGTVWSFSYGYMLQRDFLGDSTLSDPAVSYPSGSAVLFDELLSDGRHGGLTSDRLIEITSSSGLSSWELQMADGTKVHFDPLDGSNTHAYPTKITDAYGLVSTIIYNSYHKPIQITDASGRWIKIDYTPDGSVAMPSHVYASDGQEVFYQWQNLGNWTTYRMTGATYSDGTSASYTYVQTANGTLPDVCRDVRATNPVRNIKYEFDQRTTPINDFAGARILREREADTNSIISERVMTNNYFQEKRGDGATRTIAADILPSVIPWETDYLGNKQSYTYNGSSLPATVTDPKSNVTKFDYETNFDILKKVTYPDASFETYEYTGTHPRYLTKRTNTRGYATVYTLYGNGLVKQTSYPDGSSESWTYNGFNQPLTHVLKNGATESFTYDAAGILTRHTLATGDFVDYTYYPSGHPWAGRQKSAQDPRGNITTYEYDLKWVNGVQGAVQVSGRGLISKIINSDGTYKSFGYDVYGNKLWEENELRQRTAYTYDQYNRQLTETDPLGNTTEFKYGDTAASALSFTAKLPLRVYSPSRKLSTMLYDANRRVVQAVQADATADCKSFKYEYDVCGNMTKSREQVGGAQLNEVWRDTTYAYDNRNRKITEYAPLGRNTDYGYDTEGNLVWVRYADSSSIATAYDSMNRPTQKTDEMGRVSNLIYYPSGKVQWSIDPQQNSYSYWYDNQDRPTYFWLTNGSQTGFDYEQTSYDASGNVATFRNRSGAVKTFVYDGRNRETSTSWNDGATSSTATSYDSAGRVTQKSNAASTLNYSYDAGGRVLSEQQILTGGPTKTTKFEYDSDGNRTRMQVVNQ